MKVQGMLPSVADNAVAVPPVVTVIVSPDPQEIDMQLQSDPLAVDPLLVRAEDIKKEVKVERILDTCGTQMKDENIDGNSSMTVLEPMTVLIPSAVSLDQELTSQCLQEEDPLKNIPNVPPLKPEFHKTESQETLQDEKIDETSSMTVLEPVTVLVPSAVSLEEELTPPCLQEEDPLENIPNLPPLKPVPKKMESRVTLQVLRDETTSTLQSSSDLSPTQRNKETHEPSTLIESVNEPIENQLLTEGSNVGRVTRKSAAVARAKIRRTRWSKEHSSSSESNSDNSDQDYQSSDKESSDENSDDIDLGNEDEQERDWTKDVPHEIAPWCSCGMHPPSVVDDMVKQLHLNIGPQRNKLSQSSRFQQISRNKISKVKSSQESSGTRNVKHVEAPIREKSINEQSEKQGLDVESARPDHVIRKRTAVNCQLSVNENSDNICSGKEDHNQQKIDLMKGIEPEIAPKHSCGVYSPNDLDKSMHNGHQQNALSVPSLKDQLNNQDTLNNEDNSVNCQDTFIACEGIVSESDVNTTHERHTKKKHPDFVIVRSNADNVNLQSKNTTSLTGNILVKHNSVHSATSVHLQTLRNLVQKKILEDNGEHSVVNENKVLSKRNVLLKSRSILKNVSKNCELFPDVTDNNVNLIMDIESNRNKVSLGSKNTLPLTEKVSDSSPVVNDDNVNSITEVESNTNIVSSRSKNTLPLSENIFIKSRNLLKETNGCVQTHGNVIQKKVLENNQSSSIVNRNHELPESMVCLENRANVILGEISNSDQQSSVSSKSTPEKHSTMSHLIDTRQRKLEEIEKFVENCIEPCKHESTMHSQKFKKLKTINYGEANQHDQTQTKQNLKDCVDRCPKDGRILMNCPVCGIKIKKCKLKVHSLKHSDNRPIKCKLCPKAFKTINCLQSHIQHIHENIVFKCKLCEKQYKSKVHFRRHMEIHKGIEPPKAKCDICGKVFEKTNMSRHILIHSTDYKFPCNICDKKFKYKAGLQAHVSHVHDSKPRPRHICEICGVIMKSPSTLSDHMNTHTKSTPYTCDVCGKSYPSKRRLVSHMAIHGEKKFKCDICGYACSRIDNLITHIRSHTGEKPFKCCICSQTFTRQDNLQTHKRGVHKIE